MLNNYPKLDLHGEYLDNAIILVREFITDNIILKNEYIVVIHGIGTDTSKFIFKFLSLLVKIVLVPLDVFVKI